jgi:hypothetical protein
MSKKFSIIHNLESLNEEQRKAYADSVAGYYGLDPVLNPFDFIWIPDEITGFKKLVLYARRGTTDILRDKNNITIHDMIQHDGPNYVSFKAIGQNAEGRREVAVGAHSIEGLKNEKLAAAISTAETRAGRRLTLKFMGLGILDASEVNMEFQMDTTKASAAQPDGAPIVFPPPQNHVTSTSVSPFPPVSTNVEIAPKIENVTPTLESPRCLDCEELLSNHRFIAGQGMICENREQAVTQNPPNEGVSLQEIPKRKRRSRKVVDINLPGQAPQEPAPLAAQTIVLGPVKTWQPVGWQPVGGLPPTPVEVAAAEKKVEAALGLAPAVAPTQVNSVVPPQVDSAVPTRAYEAVPAYAPFPGKPSDEQQKQYRDRVRDITSRLSMAGMMPSEGIGGPPAKMRLFAERMSNKPTAAMTVDDWDDLFSSIDTFLGNNSDKNLVKYVNDVIGAK